MSGSAAARGRSVGSGARVLIVDDEPDWRRSFQDIFLSMGFKADVAGDVAEAKAKLAEESYALLLLDVVLNQGTSTLDAQIFLRFLQENHPSLPVVATSGKQLNYLDVFRLPEMGVRAYVHKPGIQLRDLELEIRHVLAEAASPTPAQQPPSTDDTRYDAFISYSHVDSAFVVGILLARMEALGLTMCIDVRDFEPGAPSVTEIERCVVNSRKTLLVLTPSYVASEWGDLENVLVQTLDPANRARRLIPLLVKPCDLPLRIRALTYVDLMAEADWEGQLDRLAAAIVSSR